MEIVITSIVSFAAGATLTYFAAKSINKNKK